ncbi:hypothetical protein Ancab_040520 [Ancistrocladus abbreviatus]
MSCPAPISYNAFCLKKKLCFFKTAQNKSKNLHLSSVLATPYLQLLVSSLALWDWVLLFPPFCLLSPCFILSHSTSSAVEMLWVDKYRPKTLDEVLVHEDVTQNLKKLSKIAPICCFMAFLDVVKKTPIRQMFGSGAEKFWCSMKLTSSPKRLSTPCEELWRSILHPAA